MGVRENITSLRQEIPKTVQVIAVSKTMPVSLMMDAYHAGQRAFGENKVQELLIKQPQLPSDTEWHLIGHLQSNKVKQIIPFVHLIHSVDSLKLLSEINKEAAKIQRIADCLLQIRIAKEETKFGLTMNDARVLFFSPEFLAMKNIRIRGLMGMATFTDDMSQVKAEFLELAGFFAELKSSLLSNNSQFNELSMGMSGDYSIAIEAGSTMVRIGSMIFGERNTKSLKN
jgi:hypothetical protein